MIYPIHWLSSVLASAFRLGAGRSGTVVVTNEGLPILYEFEGCPWCRIAREAISRAGLSVLVRPCPKGGERFRPKVTEMGGKAQFPFLVSSETGEGQYESAVIAKLMRDKHEAGRPLVHWLGPLNGILSSYASLVRFMSGVRVKPSKPQDKPLAFHGSEVSPGARLVREMLCVLELEYVWHPGTGEGIRLQDPNTGELCHGGRACIKYLKRTYSA